MTTAMIIHGLQGSPDKNWYPWLRDELQARGWNVSVSQFPKPDLPKLKEWSETFFSLPESESDDLVLIGHSLGVPFILSLLEKKKARAAFLVGGFVGDLGNPEFDEIRATFARRDFDWKSIKANCKTFVAFNSDDDPYVPLAKGEELAKNLGIRLTLVKGAGHFNKSSGYTEFPLLLEKITSTLP